MDDLVGVRLLFHEDWYDGPLSGLAEYDGRTYFYEAVWDEAAGDWTHPRRLLLHDLTKDAIAEEWRCHHAFETHVGTLHGGHVDEAEREQRPKSEWSKFYDAFPSADHDRYSHRPVIGSFTG